MRSIMDTGVMAYSTLRAQMSEKGSSFFRGGGGDQEWRKWVSAFVLITHPVFLSSPALWENALNILVYLSTYLLTDFLRCTTEVRAVQCSAIYFIALQKCTGNIACEAHTQVPAHLRQI